MPRLKFVACDRCEFWHPPGHCTVTIACPECGAAADAPCMRPSGHRVWGGTFHVARHDRALHRGQVIAEWHDMPSVRSGVRIALADTGLQQALF